MIALLLGAATLLVMMAALGMFSRAQVATIKGFAVWVAGIGALLLGALLFFTGKGGAALAILGILGPLIWSWRTPPRPGQRTGQRPARPSRASGPMSRAEAYAILGLPGGADAAAVQAAYLRLMQTAHPDRGGSDWLASRINQARDTLLG